MKLQGINGNGGESNGGQPHVVDIRNHEGVELLFDGRALSVWELLRRYGDTMSAAALARSLRCGASEVDAALRRLVDQGIVRVHPARGRRRVAAYSSLRHGVVLEYRGADPADEAALANALPRIASEGTAAAARVQTLMPAQAHDPLHLRRKLRLATHLDERDAEELRSRVDDLLAFVRLLEAKYVGEDALDAVHCNYSIDVAVHAIEAPQPAAPMVTCRPFGDAASTEEPEYGESVGALSPREREVAVGIVNGRSRSDIATRLGITVSTVATLTKRLYRKLGVHSKSQLTHRLVGQKAIA